MDILRRFRRQRPQQPPPDDSLIDPLPWEDQVSQVRTMMDALDAATGRTPESPRAADQPSTTDSQPADSPA
jgi:hypothetical protein